MPAAQLPSLYHSWIDALLGGPIPAETAATCHRCAMVHDRTDSEPFPRRDAAPVLYFHPDVKCCTYVPVLPNFLAGRILLDRRRASRFGRQTLIARLEAGDGVTPLGIERPRAHALLYDRTSDTAFGRSVAMRCPHYETRSGGCGIWRHRPSVCCTWFCKYRRGAVGHRFWTGVDALLRRIERALAAYCVLQLDPGADARRGALLSLRSGDWPREPAASDETTRRSWGHYAGREGEFYEATARLIEPLAWTDVLRLGGPEVGLAARHVRDAFEKLTSDTVPDRLQAGPVTVTFISRDALRVSTYNAFDPLVMPTALGEVLHVFDGRPTATALQAASQFGVEIDRAAVRRLVDFEVLRPPD